MTGSPVGYIHSSPCLDSIFTHSASGKSIPQQCAKCARKRSCEEEEEEEGVEEEDDNIGDDVEVVEDYYDFNNSGSYYGQEYNNVNNNNNIVNVININEPMQLTGITLHYAKRRRFDEYVNLFLSFVSISIQSILYGDFCN